MLPEKRGEVENILKISSPGPVLLRRGSQRDVYLTRSRDQIVLDIEKISQDLTVEDANKGVEEASKELEKLKGELMELNTPLENDPNIIEAKTSLDVASARLQACQYINGIRSKY